MKVVEIDDELEYVTKEACEAGRQAIEDVLLRKCSRQYVGKEEAGRLSRLLIRRGEDQFHEELLGCHVD